MGVLNLSLSAQHLPQSVFKAIQNNAKERRSNIRLT